MTIKKILSFTLMAVAALWGQAATVSNAWFTLSTPDDSWELRSDPSVRTMGARVTLQRNGAAGISELARIDVLDAPFSPDAYLHMQAVEGRDLMCRNAREMSTVAETTFASLPAKRIHFVKTDRGARYQFTAIAMNAGFNTIYVVTCRREGLPNVVGAVVGDMRFTCPTTPVTTAAQMVEMASKVLKRHSMQIADNEFLEHIEMTDTQTVELEITIPYLERDKVNVTAFVQAMRASWFKSLPSTYRLNRLIATCCDERKRLRYVYTNSRGSEIGSMLIYPEEYAETINSVKKQ